MTESIKQEIINNIFENGDKLITGPILQTVLIDMIDDVNVKDQAILSKTGSWDEAATQIPNLATKAEVTNLSESVARDLENVDVDLTGYATEQWVQNQGYLKEHQDISGLATKTELTTAENNLQGNITSLSESVARDLANVSVPEGVATEAWVQSQDYASKTYVNEAVSSSSVDLTGYATETWVQNQGYLKEHQDISNLATKSELTSVSQSIQTDISNLATKTELTSVSQSVQTDITNLSESVANSAVWKKGEGQDSVVQVIADGTNPPTATGERAVATGLNTKASGDYSHAEGFYTNASGQDSRAEGDQTNASGYESHAEGSHTVASGVASHAEGFYTIAANQYEHAQGRFNHSSENQIFSVGAGEVASGTINRRNAVSILEVPNSDTQVVTSSFFVQNIGGYDGTNPLPGTNDLATVIDRVSSIWKKGEGTDSIVQKLTNANEASEPTATGTGAVAIGFVTTASGDQSHAEGNGTNASGSYSHAEGHNTNANSYGSHAEGYKTEASSYCSHAEGDSTSTSGQSSHAEGYYAIASGAWSHAEGYSANASGNGSHAEGSSTRAEGKYSHAEGYYTETSNDYEHAQGQYNHNSTNQIFSIGAGGDENGSLTRRNAVSVLVVPNSDTQVVTASFFVQNIGGYDGTNPTPGTNDLATVINGMSSGGGSSETLWKKGTGTDSIVQVIASGEGQPTATKKRAIATGEYTEASGYCSHAEGYNANTVASYSHAEGDNTNASGRASHAEGSWAIASGDNSHAEGYDAKATGKASHAEGHFTIASNDYEHAQGRYNYTSSNQIFSVGTGNSDTDRRNAVSVLEVDNSGSYTSSFFVQNVGGYDGTNPEPGTNDLATVINGMSTGGGSSETLWKKGTGKDSAVLILTGDDEANTPTATGTGSIATGEGTKALGNYSHAEGRHTKASGWDSHAEGFWTEAPGNDSHAEGGNTKASGMYSHAEGWYAFTTNNYEHAQGMYNHTFSNQIFSVGAGEVTPDYRENRRNAVSILAVPNSETQVVTASFFVQNIGGYDGTNPTPGTNDLATVLNNTETWTFTLEDGTTVTKNIRIA